MADAIAKAIAHRVKARSFPEDFIDGSPDIDFHVTRELVKAIEVAHFLDQVDVTFLGDGGKTISEGTYPLPIADAIVRAVLWGRSFFRLSSDRDAMHGHRVLGSRLVL